MAFPKAFAALLIASFVLVHFTYALQQGVKPPAPSPQPPKPIGAASHRGKIYATEPVEAAATDATAYHQGPREIMKHALAISTLLLITAPANVLKIHLLMFSKFIKCSIEYYYMLCSDKYAVVYFEI
ncbi:putative calcium-dependent protein kinase 16-like [Capsicum annuum]|nr:putative calcium-dependent protein kinase 16-like [Capsicum annuum]